MKCPRCEIKLIEKEVCGETVLVCPEMHGLFMDQLVFAKILNRDAKSVSLNDEIETELLDDQQNAKLYCSDCIAEMVKYGYCFDKSAIIDRCTSCGKIWFDKNELERCLQIFAGQNKFAADFKKNEPKVFRPFKF